MATVVVLEFPDSATILKFKIKPGSVIVNGTVICEYQLDNSTQAHKFKSPCNGTVKELLVKEGEKVEAGCGLLNVEQCRHLTVWRNMCAECGLDLREEKSLSASVAMEHMIPDLLISEKRAQVLGQEDEVRLLKNRQLVLLVDLDQTLIHTTNDAIPPNLKDVYHFQLWPHPAWYHTKFRPHLSRFLESMSALYELHICTFGTRTYAHTIARFLDPDGRYFSQRILSRDEFFHPTLKTSNLKALFPCGDAMVCIIDDREDVWKMAPNLVHVRPYRFFDGTADINAPPEAGKAVNEDGSLVTSQHVKHTARIVKVPKKQSSLNQEKPACEQGDEAKTQSEADGCRLMNEQTSVDELSVSAADDVNKSAGSTDLTGQQTQCSEGEQEVKETVGVDKSEDSEESEKNQASEECLAEDTSAAADSSCKTVQTYSAIGESSGVKTQETALNQTEGTDERVEYEEMIEWEDRDDYLIYLEEILTRIHVAYYKVYDQMKESCEDASGSIPDLKTVVPYVRRKILKGAFIVFSGVCPLDTDITKSRIYQVAEALGAVVQPSVVVAGSNEQGPATTHLIAARLGTQKARTAARHKTIRIVSPNWLWTCADRWEWVDERLYPLNEDTSGHFLSRGSPDSNARGGKSKNDKNLSCSSQNQSTEAADKSDVLADSPLMRLSKDDIIGMDAEVQEFMEENDGSDESDDGDKQSTLDCDNENSQTDADKEADAESEKFETFLRRSVLSSFGRKRKKSTGSSDDDESLSGDFPKGWKPTNRKKTKSDGKNCLSNKEEDDDKSDDDDDDADRQEEGINEKSSGESGSSVNEDSEFNDSVGSIDDEIAAAVEREFLS